MAFSSMALGGMLIAMLVAPRISANPEQKKERSEIVCVKKREQGRAGNANTSETVQRDGHHGGRPQS
jgi:hypothetical protein